MFKRIILLMILLAAILPALNSFPDIVGNGSAIQLASSGSARWIMIVADANNVNPVRVGGPNVSSSVGAKLAPGYGMLMPEHSRGNDYQMKDVYILASSGDVVSVVWE